MDELRSNQLRNQPTSPRQYTGQYFPPEYPDQSYQRGVPQRQSRPRVQNPSTHLPSFFGEPNGGQSERSQQEAQFVNLRRPPSSHGQSTGKYEPAPYVVPILDDTRFPSLNTMLQDSPPRSPRASDTCFKGPSNSVSNSYSNSSQFQPQVRVRKVPSIERSFSQKNSFELDTDQTDYETRPRTMTDEQVESAKSVARQFARMDPKVHETRPRKLTDEQIHAAKSVIRQFAQMSGKRIQLPGMERDRRQSHNGHYTTAHKLTTIEEASDQTGQSRKSEPDRLTMESDRVDRGISEYTQFSTLTMESSGKPDPIKRVPTKFKPSRDPSSEPNDSETTQKELGIGELPEYHAERESQSTR